MASCRIVILNYNGRDLLEECLPSVLRAARQSKNDCRVTILDNQSSDDSESLVRERFPQAEFVKSAGNRVFCSYNPFLEAATEPYAILLNNDIRVAPDFVDPLISALESDPSVFFVAPQTLNYWTGKYEGGVAKLEMRWGLPWGSSKFDHCEEKAKKPGTTMQCGFGAFRKDFFVKLGGYDDLYLPGTMEDADLCFRGWQRGWKGYYCPGSVVYHMGQASFKRAFGLSGIRRLNRRNLYLFVWKNIRSPHLLLQHILLSPLQLLKYLCFGQIDFLLGFKDALFLLPKAVARRRQTAGERAVLNDQAIFAFSKALS